MSEDIKVIVIILIMIPFTLWMKKSFNNMNSHNSDVDEEEKDQKQ